MSISGESTISAQIQMAIGSRPDTRLFRNQVGAGWVGETVRQEGGMVLLRNARRVTFGLGTGTHDLIGWHTALITPDMVGRRWARFLSIEVKGNGSATPEQRNFERVVREFGGIAGLARSPEQARLLLGVPS